jgi:hypothetical protein
LPAAFVSLVISSYQPNFPFGVNIARFSFSTDATG